MSTLEREVQAASAWLQREAERTPFGSVGVTISMHRGNVAKVERSASVVMKPETGDPHDNRR